MTTWVINDSMVIFFIKVATDLIVTVVTNVFIYGYANMSERFFLRTFPLLL
jgi:hypothetical protein